MSTFTTKPNALRLAVIICTKDRPHDLQRCLRSLARQSRPPEQLLVVDASEQPLQADAWQADLPMLRVIPAPAGLPRQRNLGLAQAQADVVAFFDDDVELAEEALAQLMAVYERRWAQGIGGVMGSDPGWRQSSGMMHWLKRLFLLTHVRARGSRVRVYRSLGVAWVARPQREIPVQAMPGFCMSYNLALLRQHNLRFDESLGGYADGEDVEMSLRVARLAPCWQSPAVLVKHHRSRAARATLYRRFYTRTRNERLLQRRLMAGQRLAGLAWWWSAVGRLVVAAAVGLSQRSTAPVRGVWRGLHDDDPAR